MKRVFLVMAAMGFAACAGGKSAQQAAELPAVAAEPAAGKVAKKEEVKFVADDPLYTAAKSIVDWWPGNGNGMDLVGTRHARLQGGATFAEGRNGAMAFTFDGESGYADLGSAEPAMPASGFSYMLWFRSDKVNATNHWQYLMCCWDGGGADIALNVKKPGDWCFGVGSGEGRDPDMGKKWLNIYANPEMDEAWHHVTVTYDGAEMRMYRDGVLVAEEDWGIFTPGKSAMTLALDVPHASTGKPFKGQAQDVAMFSRALSDEEIKAIYAVQGKVGASPAPGLTLPQRRKVGAEIRRQGSPLAWYAAMKLAGAGGSGEDIVAAKAPAVDAAAVGEWIAALDHEDWQVREEAIAKLIEAGDAARPTLVAMLWKGAAGDTRARVLKVLSQSAPADAELCAARQREILVRMGGKENAELAAKLAPPVETRNAVQPPRGRGEGFEDRNGILRGLNHLADGRGEAP